MIKPNKKVIIYDTGGVYVCDEDDIYDPPEGRPRDKNNAYNEEDADSNIS